jgi:hypothetical protein
MMIPMHRSFLVFLVAFGLAGCSAPQPSAGVLCPNVILVDPQATLVAPAKGATGVPVTIGTISFTVSNVALQHGVVTLTAGGSSNQITAGAITTVNGLSSVSIPTLAPATTYTAVVASTSSGPAGTACPGVVEGNLGSFTTAGLNG